MSISQPFNPSLVEYKVVLGSNQLIARLIYTDATTGLYCGDQELFAPLDGVSPILDRRGRVVASQTPNGIITPVGTLTTAIQNAVTAAVSGGKILL